MKKLLLSAVFILPIVIQGQLDEAVWHKYLKNPITKNYLQCEFQISLEIHQAPWNDVLFPYFSRLWESGTMDGLLHLVKNGDVLATDLCFQLHPFMSGHWSEEFDIAIGRGMKSDPELFLMLFDRYFRKENNGSQYETGMLMYMLGNYGDEFVDKPRKKLAETESRIATLKTVREHRLMKLRSICINKLEEKKNRYQELIQERED